MKVVDESSAKAALFKEYDTLREEILTRVKSRFDLLTFMAAATTIVVGQNVSTTLRVAILGAAVSLVGATWFVFGQRIGQCGTRLREIEREVNAMLGGDYLVWERRLHELPWWQRLFGSTLGEDGRTSDEPPF